MAYQKLIWYQSIFELIKEGEAYKGTAQKLAEQFDMKIRSVQSGGRIIGKRFTEIKLVHGSTGDTFFDTLPQASERVDTELYNLKRALEVGDKTYKGYEISLTGRYIFEYYEKREVKQTEFKPENVKPKPVRTFKAVPMSPYWAYMSQIATKHLADYRRTGDMRMYELIDKDDILKVVEIEGNHKTFTYKGIPCEIRRIPTLNHLCGYLTLKNYNDEVVGVIDDNFHCGITYGGSGEYGFDCAHVGDIMPSMFTAESRLNIFEYETYKTMAYVERCLKRTIDALIDKELI